MNVGGLLGESTPERPGPGPLPPELLRALQIDVARRLESMLAGDYRSKRHGPGTELAQVRPYAPGDDVRLIEWNVTARTGEPHVRVNLAERVLVTWLVLDTSPSMQFGTAERRKADVAAGVAIGVGHVATRRGNRLGIVTFGDSHPQAIPPTAGRHGLLGLLAALGRDPEEQPVGATSLGRALDTAGAIARQRGIVVLVSDFRGPLDWRTPLLRVLDRHDVLAVEIRDPREQELPNVGELWLLDPETGRQIRVDTRDARLRDRFAAAAAEERTGVARVLAALGVPHLVLSTSGDWLRPFAVFLGGAEMSFGHPLALAALAAVPALAAAWVAHDRRRRRSAGAFTNLALLPNLVARAPGRMRIVPPALFLAALTLLVVGFARPHANITVPRHEATVVLAIDVSRSMQARDIAPSRMVAAQRAAGNFADEVPATYAIAVVGFGSRAFVALPPTQDRSLVRQALADLTPGEGTAIGDAVALAAKLGQKQRAVDGTVPPESVLLLSDGARDGGRLSTGAAEKVATSLHVPVSTVLLGTDRGVVQERLVGGYTADIRVPPSPATLEQIAHATGGEFFQARSAAALAAVYRHLATRVGHTTENREITDVFAAAALVLLVAGGAFSAVVLRRVP